MKRTLSVFFAVALLVTMTCTLQVSASTVNTHGTDDVVEAEDNSSFHSYANSDGSQFQPPQEVLENLTLRSCDGPDISQYQLSQEQLDAPTDALIDSILDYPYLVDLFVSSDFERPAYYSLREYFNGLAELENRPDAASVMLSKYADAAAADSDDAAMDAVYLRELLSIPLYFENLSESEAAEYIRISENR